MTRPRTTARCLRAIAAASVGTGALLDALWTGEDRFGTLPSAAAGSDFFPRGVGTAGALRRIALYVRPFVRFGKPDREACPWATGSS